MSHKIPQNICRSDSDLDHLEDFFDAAMSEMGQSRHFERETDMTASPQ
jgi:hypothetical protein